MDFKRLDLSCKNVICYFIHFDLRSKRNRVLITNHCPKVDVKPHDGAKRGLIIQLFKSGLTIQTENYSLNDALAQNSFSFSWTFNNF